MKKGKTILDGMDREILRQISATRRILTSRQIGNKIRLTDAATMNRLNKLKDKGILKNEKTGIRDFIRLVKGKKQKVKAPRSISWEIDFKDEKDKFFNS